MSNPATLAMKACPGCGETNLAHAKVCASGCGHVFATAPLPGAKRPYRVPDVLQMTTFRVGRYLYVTSWVCAILVEIATIGVSAIMSNIPGTQGASLVFFIFASLAIGTSFAVCVGALAEILRWSMTGAALLSSIDQQ